MRWASVPVAIAAGLYFAGPRVLKRAFAPPRRAGGGTPGELGLVSEEVWLKSASGARLHGWFIPAGDPAPAVVVLHGWGGSAALMLPLAPHLHRAGIGALFLDARNHGLSEHDSFTSMPRFAEDLDVAVGWLRAHPSVTNVGAIGHSVGAGAAILSASRSDLLEAVVSVAAPAHPGDMMHQQLVRIPTPVRNALLGSVQRIIGHRFDEFAPRHRIGLVTAPILLVHGSADAVVPVGDLHAMAGIQPRAEVLVVPGAGHSDLDVFEGHVGEITAFLERSLGR